MTAFPTLVLLPGMDGTGTLFEAFLKHLPTGLPTLGVAYPNDQPLGYAELAEYVQRALPTKGPLVLLGESFSGPLATMLAARLPERVSGLILCCSFVQNPRPGLAPLKPLIHMASPGLLPTSLVAKFLLGDSAPGALKALLADALKTMTPAVLRARLKAVVNVDAAADLSSIRVPVLYLRAEQDRVIPARVVQATVRTCRDARVVSFAGPHGLLQVSPAPTAAAVATFVRSLLDSDTNTRSSAS